jgi:isopentenyl-diphosphate delta-isomerase
MVTQRTVPVCCRTGMSTVEQVVLVDETGAAIGTAAKATVHGADTPLHLAFSCYLFDGEGRVLFTRRAPAKQTWPGVWSNSCCGHPQPAEPFTRAIRRRLRDELGVAVGRLDPILPRFRYRAVMPDGTAENELCPVFRAFALNGTTVRLNPDEVAEARWVPWAEMVALAADESVPVSPWCRSQVPELVRLGDDPSAWPVAEIFPAC